MNILMNDLIVHSSISRGKNFLYLISGNRISSAKVFQNPRKHFLCLNQAALTLLKGFLLIRIPGEKSLGRIQNALSESTSLLLLVGTLKGFHIVSLGGQLQKYFSQ